MNVAPLSKNPAASAPIENKPKDQAGVIDCPDCMTPRRAIARYCEVCRYDFELGASFNGLPSVATPVASPVVVAPIVAAPSIAVDPLISASASALASAQVSITAPVAAATVQSVDLSATSNAIDINVSSAPAHSAVNVGINSPIDVAIQIQRLKLVIWVDPSLYTEPDPDIVCPVGNPIKEYHLDLDEQTLGRQYEGKGIYPEIVVQDPGVSRRHLKFMRDEKGNHTVLDVGSANGTVFNQQPLETGIVMVIHVGDELQLGMWTRIRVELR